MKKFDRESLAADSGEQANPIFIAHEGKVYDVSSSALWKGGLHMKRHAAGRDLSGELAAAPHGTEVFTRYPQVGVLDASIIETRYLPPFLASLIKRFPMLQRHPHPMMVHFPIVFFLAVALFDLLFVVSGEKSFETTALHCLVAGIISLPAGVLTGFFTWCLNYMAKPMKAVTLKIILSTVLFAVSVGVLFWRIRDPDILDVRNASGIIYLLLVLSFVPMVSVIGWLGGSLTFPAKSQSQ